MAKGKKNAPQYESGTLAAFAAVGILLITVGVVTLLAVVGGLKGAFFSQVKQIMQGLGGGLCIGVSVLMIWGGVLVAFSTGRSMPKRGFLLITLLFLAVLGMLNLLSKVGQYGLMDYLVGKNNAATPPVADAAGYASLIRAGFDVCKTSGAFGGALGILLAWPAWTFLGTTFGAVALGLICVICVLLVSRFDLLQMAQSIREGSKARGEQRRQARAHQEYQQQLERQRQQAEEDDRRLLSPAFRRKKTPQPAQEPQPQLQQAYPPYGSMLVQQPPVGDAQAYPAYGFPGYPPQAQQQEIYDEIIPPEGWQLPWRKSEKKPKKEKKEPYQTRMTFTPSEMGVAPDETQLNDTLIMSASKRKAMERIEEIRKRKAEINEDLVGNEMAQLADGFAPAVHPSQPTALYLPVH